MGKTTLELEVEYPDLAEVSSEIYTRDIVKIEVLDLGLFVSSPGGSPLHFSSHLMFSVVPRQLEDSRVNRDIELILTYVPMVILGVYSVKVLAHFALKTDISAAWLHWRFMQLVAFSFLFESSLPSIG